MSRRTRCRFVLYVSNEYYRGAGLDVECELSLDHAGPHEATVRSSCTSYKWYDEGEGPQARGRYVETKLRWEDER